MPTMGALHNGHLELVKYAGKLVGERGKVGVSIFVNPKQFDRDEDYAAYPRPLEADTKALRELGVVDYLYTPQADEVYPPNWSRRYEIPSRLNDCLCGGWRPGHFQAVVDVVERLFTLTDARLSVFGEKDYQQLLIMKNMVADLKMNLEIVTHPLVREADGLAHSSRNTYLDEKERQSAANLYRVLQIIAQTKDLWKNPAEPLAWGIDTLEKKGFKVEYLELRSNETLKPITAPPGRLFVAAFLGSARLIDNLAIDN